MADSLNIKNPSVRQGDLDLRTDASGNIVSISGHPIAGGGGGGTTYYGDNEYIQIKNGTVNTFTVTDKVKDVVDNLTEKIALQIDAQTYNKNAIDTKLSAKQDELVFEGYDDKIESINGSGFIVNGYVSDFAYNIDKNNFNKKIDYLSASVSGKEDKLTFEYDEDNKVSAINGSALAGQGGTTYTPGQYINIDSNNEISVTGLVAADEYATYSGDWNDASNSYKTNSGSFLTSEALTNYATKTYVDGKDPVLIGGSNITATSSKVDNHTQWNLAVNVTPVVTDTKLVGDNCVTAHTTQTSGEWIVGLEQTAYEAIDSIDDISNDVTTLKNASANWNKVSDKLDTTAFSTVSGNFLTAHQSLDDYATKTDINGMATQTWVGEQGFYTKASGDNDYAPKSVTATINTLTGASAGWNEVTAKLDKSIYSNASGNWEASYNVLTAYSAAGTWLTAHQNLDNYYTKTQVDSTFASATQLNAYLTTAQYQTDSAKYVTSSNVTTQDTDYVMTTTGWKVLTLTGGGMTQVIHDETLTGQGNADNSKLGVAWSALSGNTINSAKSATVATEYYDATQTDTFNIAETINTLNDDIEDVSGLINNKVDKPTTSQTGKLVYDSDTSAWSDIGLDDYVPYSATELVIGSGNEVDYQYNNVKNNFVQGTNNIVTNNNSETFVQGKANKLFTSQDSLLQGYGNSATNYYNFAQGALNNATLYSFTQGSNNTANNLSQAAGQTNSAITASVAFGNANTAKDYSVAQGTVNSADTTAFAQGSANTAKYGSVAQGWSNSAFYYALAQGKHNSADYGSFAQGQSNIAQAYSIAQGWYNSASDDSVAQGSNNYAKYCSQAFGFGLSIEGQPGGNGTYFSGGLALGTYNQTSAGVALVIGDGHSNGADATPTRSDSFIIYADGSVSAKGDISANGVKLGAGGSFTGVTAAGSISGDGLTNPLGLVTSAEQALTSVYNKVDKPSSLVNKYLVLRTDGNGDVSGWSDLQEQCYSKSEASGTFVATANIDTTTLSGNGKTTSTKLGVKTDVIATKDYVNSSFLPLSGGTVSGQLEVHGGSNFDTQFIKLTREGNSCGARIGLGSDTTDGTLALKTFNSQGQNTVQVNIKHNTNNNELIQVQKGGTNVGFLIPAVTATTTAGITDDGILHIIIES